MSAPPIEAARAWLARSASDPEHAYRWWANNPDGVAIMPMGRRFDAVEIPAPLSGSILPHPAITGPAFAYATTRAIYILVPPGSADAWTNPHALCLGDGHYLGVPDPSRSEPVGAHWVAAPDGSGALTSPGAVLSAITEAVALLGEEDGE